MAETDCRDVGRLTVVLMVIHIALAAIDVIIGIALVVR